MNKRKEIKRNYIPPISPPLQGENVVEEKTWRDDFKMYLFELTAAYDSLLNDPEFITGRQRRHWHCQVQAQ